MTDAGEHVNTWESFWRYTCCNADGTLNLDAIQRELHDYRTITREVSKVYFRLTGGRVSKINTQADVVISLVEDYFSSEE